MAFDYQDEEDKNWFQRNGGLVIFGVIVLVGAGIFLALKFMPKGGSSQRSSQITMVSLPPPPPPPPKPIPTPPPQQQPTPEQEEKKPMEEQQPVPDEKKAEAPKEKPDEPAPLQTTIGGAGGPNFGLGYGSGGSGGLGGGGGGGGGSKYGAYAYQLQNRIKAAIADNKDLSRSSITVKARIWVDQSGRVTRATVAGGDARLSQELRDSVLNNLQLTEAPPPDMPMPIVMMVTAKRP